MITRNVELNRLIAEQNAPDACFTEREKRIMDIALAAQYQYDTSIEGVRQRRARNFDMKTDEHQAVASTTLVSVWVAERRANPKNFEGREFKWQADWFVPVQMATGHMMVHCIAATARAAWDTFTMHYWTKKERMAQGWRVKRIRITPDWTPNAKVQGTAD